MTKTIRTTRSFTEIAMLIADETQLPSERFATAFAETADTVRLAATDDAIVSDMPDALSSSQVLPNGMTGRPSGSGSTRSRRACRT